MIFVIDVNILLSAFIKDGTTRDIILNSDLELCFPEISLVKLKKYHDLIIKKSNVSEKEYLILKESIFSIVRIISSQELKPHKNEALEIMEHIDPEDTTFIAAALSQENAVIWSDDKHFEKQDRIITLKTQDVINYFMKKQER